MWMTDFIRQVQKAFVKQLGFEARTDVPKGVIIPKPVPDGDYYVKIKRKKVHVHVKNDKVFFPEL